MKKKNYYNIFKNQFFITYISDFISNFIIINNFYRLERIVFGDTNDVIKNLLKTKNENVSAEQESDDDTKSMSDCNDDGDDSKLDNHIMDDTASIDETEEKLKPAWIDEDDKYSCVFSLMYLCQLSNLAKSLTMNL